MKPVLFPLATVVVMTACFLIATWASAACLARCRPGLVADGSRATAWIDGLRGLAATLVMLNHVPLIIAHHLRLTPTIEPEAAHFANYLGVIGVQIFFCVTGHLFAGRVLGSSSIDWTDFFVRRIRRLVPVYTLAVVAALAIGAVVCGAGAGYGQDLLTNLPHLLSFGIFPLPTLQGFDMRRLLGVNWTLAIEWRFYAVLPLLFALRHFGRMNAPVSLLVFTLLLAPLLGVGIWLYFIVGAVATFLPAHRPKASLRAVLVMLACLAAASMASNWQTLALHRIGQGLHVAILFFSLCLLRPRWLGHGAAAVLGALSYSLYLLHVLVLFVVFGLYHCFMGDVTTLSAVAFAGLGAFGIACSVLTAALSHEWIERRFVAARPPAVSRMPTAAPAPLSPVVTRETLSSAKGEPSRGSRRPHVGLKVILGRRQ